MIESWLQEKMTVAEIEAKNLITVGETPMPFGDKNSEWRDLLSQMQKNDELWFFSSPPDSWKSGSGCAGFSLVRNGKIVASMVTETSY